MNKLNSIEKLGLCVTWKLIDIDLCGTFQIPPQLSKDDLLDYLYNKLNVIDENTDDIISVVCESDDFDKCKKIVNSLATKDMSDSSLQFRKWRVLLLQNLINEISADYFQGILQLMEFWTIIGIPKNSPNVFPQKKKLYL